MGRDLTVRKSCVCPLATHQENACGWTRPGGKRVVSDWEQRQKGRYEAGRVPHGVPNL